MGTTKIEWATHSWNPVTGCSPVSEACQNCYARRMADSLRGRFGYPQDEPFRVTLHPERLEEPSHWRKPSMVFVCSMGDLFHEDVPDEFINQVFTAMTHPMCGASHHTYLLLTKRPERILQGHCERFAEWRNLWLGITAENQARADERIPILLQIPAAVRFISCEPLLERVDLERQLGSAQETREVLNGWHGIDWVICGSESGLNRRETKTEWIRDLRNQCISANVPFFLKQMDVDGKLVKMPELDGKVWAQFPERGL